GVGSLDLTNTIVTGGSPVDCSGGGVFSSGTHGHGSAAGHNLDSDGSCGLSASNGDLPHTAPMLGPLANNGGLTHTMALQSGSPAIGHANQSACPAVD